MPLQNDSLPEVGPAELALAEAMIVSGEFDDVIAGSGDDSVDGDGGAR